MKFPIPKKIPHTLTQHGHSRTDNYFWMRDRDNEEVISHIQRENAYAKWAMKSTEKLQETLYEEMKGKIKEDDSSPPYYKNGYWYYSRYETGAEYPTYCRKKENLSAPEEIFIDENEEAEDWPYYEIVAFAISRDNKMLAFAEDVSGRRMYRIRFKNLETGEIYPHCLENCGSDLTWHNDNRKLYFTQKSTDTLRTHQVLTFNLETGKSSVVYEDLDETYSVSVDKTADAQFIFVGSHSTLTTTFKFKSAADDKPFIDFLPRIEKHEYYPESAGNRFIIKTNHQAENFKLVSCPIDARDQSNWAIIQPHQENVLIEDFEVFKSHVVVQEKENGLSQLRVYDQVDWSNRMIPPAEETYTLFLENNAEYDQKAVRIGYTSMTTPYSIFDIDLKSFERTCIKQTEVLGDFDSGAYRSERIWVLSQDNTEIPVSLVYRKDHFQKNGKNPLLLYAYGAYGSTVDPYFSSNRLSLLDRGFVFAIAHVRGGEYLGTKWYEAGKLLQKKNTFYDFIAAAEKLAEMGYCDPANRFAMGGSAGGLLTTAVTNLKPELWKGVLSEVPFVDVISTMIDETIPLTTGEYDEWGNPAQKAFYEYMLSYSPYDQIEKKAYPSAFVTSGLHDSQVQFWEPTKYVAKLREHNTNNNLILLKTYMDAGHGGAPGRYEQLRETAEEYAFILMLYND